MEKRASFKGHDFLELADYWGIDTEKEDDEIIQEMIQKIEGAVVQLRFLPNSSNEVANDLRSFVQALWTTTQEHDFPESPIWEGLLKIKDDDTFLQFCIPLLRNMWN